MIVLYAVEGWGGFKLKGERIWLAWFFGTAGFAGFQFLVFLGQKMAGKDGALTASIMMATMPMLGFLVNWVARRVRPPGGALGFILLSFAGVTLVVTKGHYSQLMQHPSVYGADGLIIFGALCWVIYTVGAAFFPQWSPYKYTTITTGLGLGSSVVITAVLLATGAIDMPGGSDVIAISPQLAYMATTAGFVGVLCWNLGNKILTPLNGVLFMDIVPVTAFTVSAIQGVHAGSIQKGGDAGAVAGLVAGTPVSGNSSDVAEVARSICLARYRRLRGWCRWLGRRKRRCRCHRSIRCRRECHGRGQPAATTCDGTSVGEVAVGADRTLSACPRAKVVRSVRRRRLEHPDLRL